MAEEKILDLPKIDGNYVCPECLKKSIRNNIVALQITRFQALYCCSNEECVFPLLFRHRKYFIPPFQRHYECLRDEIHYPDVFYGPLPLAPETFGTEENCGNATELQYASGCAPKLENKIDKSNSNQKSEPSVDDLLESIFAGDEKSKKKVQAACVEDSNFQFPHDIAALDSSSYFPFESEIPFNTGELPQDSSMLCNGTVSKGGSHISSANNSEVPFSAGESSLSSSVLCKVDSEAVKKCNNLPVAIGNPDGYRDLPLVNNIEVPFSAGESCKSVNDKTVAGNPVITPISLSGGLNQPNTRPASAYPPFKFTGIMTKFKPRTKRGRRKKK